MQRRFILYDESSLDFNQIEKASGIPVRILQVLFIQMNKLSPYPGSAFKHLEVQRVPLDGPIEQDQRVAAGHGCTQGAPRYSLAQTKSVDFLETGREDK